MFDFDGDMDLGARQKPAQWVAVAPAVVSKPSTKPKRRKAQQARRQEAAQAKLTGQPSKAALERLASYHEKTKHKQEKRDHSLHWLAPEDEEGNVEYKYRIHDPNPVRYQQLVTQMKFRLSEGNGECFYYIGVEDDGYPRGLEAGELQGSVETLQAMARGLWATASVEGRLAGALGRECLVVRVSRDTLEELALTDLRVAVVGSVDTGKSSLVAVLTHGMEGAPLLDNGRGAARMKAFRHKHEIESGRTSSISQHAVGYDAAGRVLNYAGFAPPTLSEIGRTAARLLTLIDIGGHQRYLKTALYALTAMLPDHLLLATTAAAAAAPDGPTRQHLALAVALQLPTAILLTKADLHDPTQLATALDSLRRLVAPATAPHTATPPGLPHPQDDPLVLLTTEAEAAGEAAALNALHSAPPGVRPRWQARVPVIAVSSVTGEGLPLLHAFLRALEPAPTTSTTDDDTPASETTPWAGLAPAGPGAAAPPSGVPQQWGPQVLPPRTPAAGGAAAAHFQVDQTFEVAGVGLVASGTLLSGALAVGQQLLWGPCGPTGSFLPASVKGIHRSHIPVQNAHAGQRATVAIDLTATPPGTPPQLASSPSSTSPITSRTPTPPRGPHLRALPAARPAAGCTAPLAHPARPGPPPHLTQDSASSNFLDDLATELSSGFDLSNGDSDSGFDHAHEDADAFGFFDLGPASPTPPSPPPPATSQLPGPLPPLPALLGSSLPAPALPFRAPPPTSPHPLPSPGARLSTSAPTRDNSPLSPLGPPAAPVPTEADGASRKGAVLLDPRLQPHAFTHLEAVLVLLGGHWPPRGLLSGCWPPLDGDEACAEGSGGGSGSGEVAWGRSRKRRPCYVPVVHCGSVRQPAEVVSMREVRPECLHHAGACDCGAGGGHRALLRALSWPADAYGEGGAQGEGVLAPLQLAAEVLGQEGGDDVGCVAVVGLRFEQRPQWAAVGSKVLLRDRTTGLLAAAGFVRSVW